jgi:replicative DNA helicase
MNKETMAKMVLRSLCANTPDEEVKALENYRYTNIDAINLSAVEGNTFELIKQFYERSHLAGPPSIAALIRFAEADLDANLILYLKEVGVESQTFGASYRSLFSWFIGDLVGSELSELLQQTNQVLKEGVKTKVGANTELKQGVKDALEHVVLGATKLKQHLNPNQQPMDLHLGAKELAEDYIRKSRNPAFSYGLTTNISAIDDATGGAQNKELWVLAGATLDPRSRVFDFESGDFITLGELEISKNMPLVASLDVENRTTKLTRPDDVYFSSYKNLITFNVDGTEQKVSPDHPFFTPNGWVKAEQLKDGDYVARPHQIDWEGTEHNPKAAEMAGLLAGDGHSHPQYLFMGDADGDYEEVIRFQELGLLLGYPVSEIDRYFGDERGMYCRIPRCQIPEPLKNFCGQKAETKEFPRWVMKGTRETIIAALRGYWNTDGWVSKGKGGLEIAVGSNSRKLLEQVQILLLRLGIPSKFTKPGYKSFTYNGEKKRSKFLHHTLKVKQSGELRFLELIKIRKNVGALERRSDRGGRLPSGIIFDDWFERCVADHNAVTKARRLSGMDTSREQWKENRKEWRWVTWLDRARRSVTVDRNIIEKALVNVPDRNTEFLVSLDWGKISDYKKSEIKIRMVDYTVTGTSNMMVDGVYQHNTGHGKTVFAINWARHLVLLGFNVLFYSLEMSKDKVMKMLYCSHACNPKFNRKPLLHTQIKFGTLSPEDADFYLNTVIPDLKSASGSIQVFNPLGRTTIEDIQQQAEVFNREHPLDIVFIDYVNILSAPKGVRLTRSERIAENINRAKQLALEFDNGYGVTVVTPCQVSRMGEKKAIDANGVYDRDAIADTSELEKTADALFTVFQDKPLRQKREAIICNLKMRDAGLIDSFPVYMPAEYRFVGETASANDAQLSRLLVV